MNKPKLIKKYRNPAPPQERTVEEEDKAIAQLREETYKKIARLKGLINSNKTGWKDFVDIIQSYIEAIYLRKMSLNHNDLLIKSEDQRRTALNRLALLDQDIYTLEWVLQAPLQFITQAEESEKELQKQEENKNVKND